MPGPDEDVQTAAPCDSLLPSRGLQTVRHRISRAGCCYTSPLAEVDHVTRSAAEGAASATAPDGARPPPHSRRSSAKSGLPSGPVRASPSSPLTLLPQEVNHDREQRAAFQP